MKILHVMPAFYPAFHYGGPIQSVYNLCCSMAKLGYRIRVLTTNANGPGSLLNVDTKREIETNKIYIRYCKRNLKNSVSFSLLGRLVPYIYWADIVHLTGVYSFPTIPTLIVCNILKKPLIWSPRGALQRWEGATNISLKKLWENLCLNVAPKNVCFHTTSHQEAKESLDRFKGFNYVVIPNGVEIPELVKPSSGNGIIRILFIGRLHAKKGLENLIYACKILKDKKDIPLSLTIAGSGDFQYEGKIQSLIKDLGLTPQIKMAGEKIGEAKKKLFEDADMSVVPSFTENFGMVVAEALAHGVPVIAAKGTPWNRLDNFQCGFWVDNDPISLSIAIERMSKMAMREMGKRGRIWMEKEFSWDDRAREMIKVYKKVKEEK